MLARERDVEVFLVPFELRPDMPEEGYQISELQAIGASERVEEHLHTLAAREGFPLVIPPFLPKTHLAMSLSELGRDKGPEVHSSVHHAIFGAYFGRGEDIGSRDVLLEVAAREGLSRDEAEEVWEQDAYADRLHRFRHLGLHLGIDGTPAALICNELLTGSRPYAVLKDSVDRCLVTPDNIAEHLADD